MYFRYKNLKAKINPHYEFTKYRLFFNIISIYLSKSIVINVIKYKFIYKFDKTPFLPL